MSYTIAIRGIPNFAHLQYMQVERLEDLLNIFTVRARRIVCRGYAGEFYNADGKRVMLHLAPRDASPDILFQWCDDLFMRPSQTNASAIGASGTATRRVEDGYWFAIRPDSFPTYAQALQDAKDAERARVEVEQARQAQEEAMEKAMQEALEAAIARLGYDKVMQILNNA